MDVMAKVTSYETGIRGAVEFTIGAGDPLIDFDRERRESVMTPVERGYGLAVSELKVRLL